jgi:hypothetical protein
LAVVVTVAKSYDVGYIWKTQDQASAVRATRGYYINAAALCPTADCGCSATPTPPRQPGQPATSAGNCDWPASAPTRTMADRQEWEHVTACSRRLAVAAVQTMHRQPGTAGLVFTELTQASADGRGSVRAFATCASGQVPVRHCPA